MLHDLQALNNPRRPPFHVACILEAHTFRAAASQSRRFESTIVPRRFKWVEGCNWRREQSATARQNCIAHALLAAILGHIRAPMLPTSQSVGYNSRKSAPAIREGLACNDAHGCSRWRSEAWERGTTWRQYGIGGGRRPWLHSLRHVVAESSVTDLQ